MALALVIIPRGSAPINANLAWGIRWNRIQRLKDQKGHELLSTADVHSFLQSCREAEAQLRGRLADLDVVDLDVVDHHRGPLQLASEEKNQNQTLRDIQALEAKIAYLRGEATKYGLSGSSLMKDIIIK